jgi:predicted O-linked N-acetylglucosamine transferase (SPINDLY family)/TolA-binding protein
MDYQKFLSSLPSLYDNWGQDSVRPKSNQFQQILEQVGGMTTANVMQLLNFAVDCMEADDIYCEVGCFQGANLIAALLEHPNQMAYAVDNFYDFDPAGESFNKLIDNLSTFSLEEQVFVCNQDWEEFLFELKTVETENKISVYFANGVHDYRAQILALLLVRPYLAEQALIIIGNSNISAVKQASWDFIAAHPQSQIMLDLPTPEDGHCTFWNGIQILSWDSERDYNYEFLEMKNQRNNLLIQSIFNCSLELEDRKKSLEKLREEAIDLDNSGSYEQAENKYKELLKWDKNQADVLFYLGMLYYKTNRYQQALDLLFKSLKLEPSKAVVHYNLGLVLEKIGNITQAIQAYEQAIALEPQWSAPYINLGSIWFKVGNFEQAELNYRKVIDAEPSYFSGYLNLGNALFRQYKVDEAITNYQQALQLKPHDQDILSILIVALQESGRTQEAIAFATEASQTIPKSVDLRLKKHLLLPFIYETEDEIDFYRHRFIQGLEELIQQTSLETSEEEKNALIAIGGYTNFFLQYQGKNDVELQKRYGQFVHRIMAANYPQWSQPLTMPPLSEDKKIRIGYVSSCLRKHNGAKWALGWIENHNREKFEVYCYKTDFITDKISQEFQLLSDTFHHIPDDIKAVCNQIVSDKLHILIFPDIGMFPLTTQIAGLRLAPVQCTAWGHPITSGLPTIDYYLSSNLMEPEKAQEQYSEQLVRLPNIGLCYPKPVIGQQSKTRSDFQLRDDAIVYLSCQSLFKYLPQYDYIFAAIAQQVPQAQFAFISFPSIEINRKFQQRLQRAFAKFSLNSEDYCVILPRQNPVDYFNLNLVSDVYLDTFSWTGGNSTMEAITCNLPIVTSPGEFMRGRHSYAILKMLGVTDTIADNEAEYIEIAVKLGLDREWRDSIVKQMVQRHSYLFDDKTCVEALDAFFSRVVVGAS